MGIRSRAIGSTRESYGPSAGCSMHHTPADSATPDNQDQETPSVPDFLRDVVPYLTSYIDRRADDPREKEQVLCLTILDTLHHWEIVAPSGPDEVIRYAVRTAKSHLAALPGNRKKALEAACFTGPRRSRPPTNIPAPPREDLSGEETLETDDATACDVLLHYELGPRPEFLRSITDLLDSPFLRGERRVSTVKHGRKPRV